MKIEESPAGPGQEGRIGVEVAHSKRAWLHGACLSLRIEVEISPKSEVWGRRSGEMLGATQRILLGLPGIGTNIFLAWPRNAKPEAAMLDCQ